MRAAPLVLVGLMAITMAWPEVAEGARRSRQGRSRVVVSPWRSEPRWIDQAVGKLGYGLKNALFGWTELVTEPYAASRSNRSVLAGIGRGIWNAVGDTTGGVVQAVTFPATHVDVLLPQGGV